MNCAGRENFVFDELDPTFETQSDLGLLQKLEPEVRGVGDAVAVGREVDRVRLEGRDELEGLGPRDRDLVGEGLVSRPVVGLDDQEIRSRDEIRNRPPHEHVLGIGGLPVARGDHHRVSRDRVVSRESRASQYSKWGSVIRA